LRLARSRDRAEERRFLREERIANRETSEALSKLMR
jgi:hypothetical protein